MIDLNTVFGAAISVDAQYYDVASHLKICPDFLHVYRVPHKSPHLYCPICGKKLQEKEIISKYVDRLEKIVGEDRLVSYAYGGRLYLYSNFGAGILKNNPDTVQEITPEGVQSLKTSFIEKHQKEIDVLSQHYNKPINIVIIYMNCYQ